MADSDGSCYTLQTDDGDIYALVGGDRRPLARGTVVRARTTDDPPPAPLLCLGQPVTIESIEPVS